MNLADLHRNSLKSIGRSIGLDVQMVEGRLHCTPLDPDDPRYSLDFMLPSMPMVNACRADNFEFFQPLIESGDLTIDQMLHAAQRYLLGKSRSGLPIFWMIDDLGIVYDGHLGSSWVSTTLKSREPLLQYWKVKHCLFGLHLLHWELSATGNSTKTNPQLNKPISIVESEQSAVILSELLPESLWMAYCSNSNLTVDLLKPLQDYTVTIYPRTDPTMSNYLFFHDYANYIRRTCPSIHLTVDETLEQNASDSQRSSCIDLLDFILDK